jgi:hypothetical protein
MVRAAKVKGSPALPLAEAHDGRMARLQRGERTHHPGDPRTRLPGYRTDLLAHRRASRRGCDGACLRGVSLDILSLETPVRLTILGLPYSQFQLLLVLAYQIVSGVEILV